ncbi:MAG: hypothetical protein EBU92_14060 [Betaproteobacteria bacterium]|nr:hypothetical protein [Betaproteobacteria bacterium]
MRWVVVLVVALAALGMWHMMFRAPAPFSNWADPTSEAAQQAYAIEFSRSTLEPHILSGTKTCDGRYTYASQGNFVRDDGQRQVVFIQYGGMVNCSDANGKFVEVLPRDAYTWTVTK